MNSFHSNNSSTLHPNRSSQNLWQQQESFYRVIHHQDQSSSRSQPNKSVTSYSQSELANNISCDQDSSVQISNGFLAGISFNSGKPLENQLGGHQEGFLNHQQKDNPKEDRQGKIENYKRKIQEKSQKSEWHFNAYRDAQYGLKQAYHDFHIYTNIELEISDLYNRWGFQLAKDHEYHEAIAQYSRAAGIRQNVVTQCNQRARWLHMKNHWPYAKEIGEKGKKSETELKDIYGNWAWALSRLKDYENAEVMYKKATKLDWKDTKVLRNWGYTLSLQGFYESALEKYEQVRDLDPRDGSVYINMGYCYMKLKIFDKSVTYYTNAIQLSPNDPKMKQEALYGWGKVLDDQGDYEEAVKKFEEAADIEEAGNKNTDKPAVKCLNRLGLLLYRLEKYEAALGLFTRLMNENPRYVFLSINTGLVYAQIEYRKGKQEIYFDSSKIQEIDFGEDYRKRAHENYNKAIDKFRNDAYLHTECISAFEREIKRNEERLKKDQNRDELRAVITEMTRVLQKVKDLEYFSLHSPNVSDSMIGNRQSEDSSVSERSYNLVDDSGRSDLDFEISTIQTLNSSIISDLDLQNWVKKLNSDEKIRHFPELLKIQKETSDNWFKSFEKEKPGSESARKAYERYVKLELGESKIWNRWGYELSVIHNYEEAIEKYQRSDKIKLKIERFNNKLIEFRVISNSQNGEKVDIQKQIRHDLSGVYKNWGYALTHLGRFEEAIMKYKEAIKYNRKNDGAYKEWGYTLSKQGKHEEAIEKSEEALKLRPNAERVLINMAHSFAMLGEFDRAETLCKDVLGEEGEVTVVKREAYYEWGNTLDEKGYLEGARDMFNAAALYVGESNVKSVNRLGLIDYYQRNYEAAQDKFNRIIREDDQYGYAYINNGLVEAQIEAQKRSLPLDDVVNPNSADQAQMLNMPQKNLSFQHHLEIYHKAVDKEINRLKRDAAAYEVTINELNGLVGKLETLEPSINEDEEHKGDVDLKNSYYNEGMRIIKEKPYLKHDYVGVYKNELRKAERRMNYCRERMRQLPRYKMPY